MPQKSTAGGEKRSRGTGSEKKFPGKLYDLIMFSEQAGLQNAICWSLSGRGFMINDSTELEKLLPRFFGRRIQYRSFRRQLILWDFERIRGGPNKGIFLHPYFVRGNKELCGSMCRQLTALTGDNLDRRQGKISSTYSTPSNVSSNPSRQPPSNKFHTFCSRNGLINLPRITSQPDTTVKPSCENEMTPARVSQDSLDKLMFPIAPLPFQKNHIFTTKANAHCAIPTKSMKCTPDQRMSPLMSTWSPLPPLYKCGNVDKQIPTGEAPMKQRLLSLDEIFESEEQPELADEFCADILLDCNFHTFFDS